LVDFISACGFLEKLKSLCVLTRKPVILFTIAIVIVIVTGFASVKVDVKVKEDLALNRRKKRLSNQNFCYWSSP
jgi:hypothetical protein